MVLLFLAACGLLQDYDTALRLYCDAPSRCAGCDADPDLAAAWAEDQLWNGQARMVFDRVHEFEPAKRGPILRTAASRADIRPCAMADLYEGAAR